MWSANEVQRPLRKRRQNLEIGLTPLIDIVFLLLIFFMLTSRFVVHEGMKVDLPITERFHALPPSEGSVIFLRRDGTVFFEGRGLSLKHLQRSLIQQQASVLAKPIEIQSDRGASVQSMVTLLEVLRNLGAEKVTIVTLQEPLSSPP
jgi:biopolymer transport protein ExbD